MTLGQDAQIIDPNGLSSRDFKRLAEFIQDTCGIRMPPTKKTMLEGRLRRRVRALGLPSLSDYCGWLFDRGRPEAGHSGDEIIHLIDAVTTNKTDFFRERQHFDHLVAHTLPTLLETPARPGLDRPLKVWSAACSTGSEPYTLAMVLDDFTRKQRGFRFEILATDICTDVLAKGKHAVYPEEMIAPVPHEWRHRYFLRSRNRENATIRVAPFIRQMVKFGRLNLMDEAYPIEDRMDIIFCRNILIYFDRERQEAVLRRLCEHLRPDGYLFVGHTDTITGMDLPLRQVTMSVFSLR
ncbi:MAG: CheR family methyltransferase [Rhodospirillaceae bacterium]